VEDVARPRRRPPGAEIVEDQQLRLDHRPEHLDLPLRSPRIEGALERLQQVTLLAEERLRPPGLDQLARDRHREVGLPRARRPDEEQPLRIGRPPIDPRPGDALRVAVSAVDGREQKVLERAVIVPSRDPRAPEQPLPLLVDGARAG
jgi:hypothetical protein